jgi:hypothetical protein
MASLQQVQAFLNIEIGDKRLHDGKKHKNKNQYYYYEQAYYIVKLTKDKWIIAEDCRKTRVLLRKHCWCSDKGYANTTVNKSSKKWHQLYFNYEAGLVADHINNNKFDNRIDNIRIATPGDNNRNRTKSTKNTSGKQGVCRWTNTTAGLHYWKVRIVNNNGKTISKVFSIKKLGDDEAKRQAIEHRKRLEVQFGYIGD